jgi:hypothetical protein
MIFDSLTTMEHASTFITVQTVHAFIALNIKFQLITFRQELGMF